MSKEGMLGTEGKGLSIAYTSLMSGRLGVSSGSLGVIDSCLNSALERARTRRQHGKEIGKHQLIQSHISAITLNREQARWPTYVAALAKQRYNGNQQDRTLRGEADFKIAIAKRIASKCSLDSADRAVQVFGGFGYSILSGPARHLCDSRVTRIYEGTDEILDLKIASTALGKGFEAYS
jgi:alkylation response protein AidB-like acyl-CoA dehydrogenase